MCLDDEALASYLGGTLDAVALTELELHVEECEACRELLAWSARAQPHAPDHTSPPTFRRGTTLGRYILIEPLGRGAMGIVWSAYDPQLEREVAVKLVRSGLESTAEAASRRARLEREAQALARVSHPNVIAVYDVGTVDDQIFIAMELVQGATLTEWLSRTARSSADVLDVFQQAGRGLLAAHDAGVVHRDFKPANVLVGEDGRVRVLDFGLARQDAVAEAEQPRTGAPADSETATATGTLMGTPAYMAPEQRAGRADARADQYSFCVALVEALVGARPKDDQDATLHDRRLSPWLQRIMQRGLAAEPAQRFESMRALLGALSNDPARRRRRWLLGIGFAGFVVAAVVSGRAMLERRAAVCVTGRGKLAGIWDDPRRAELAAHFRASGVSTAEAALRSTTALLDGYADAWVNVHRDACEATLRRGEQSEALLDLRMSCLSDRVRELKVTTDLLVAADPKTVLNAVRVAEGIAPLATCSDANALRGVVPPPPGAEAKRTLATLSERIAVADALERSGSYEAGLASIERAAEEARRFGYAPVLAEALRVKGALEGDLGRDADGEQTLLEAGIAAEQAHDDRLAVNVRLELAYLLLSVRRSTEALHWASFAQAALTRIADDPLLRAWVHDSRGMALESLGKLDEARREASEGLALREQVRGPFHRDVARSLVNLGVIHERQGALEEALASYRRAFDVLSKVLGPEHPDLAINMRDMAKALTDLGRLGEGISWTERALAIDEKTLGPQHRRSVSMRVALADLLRRDGQLERARTEARRALELAEALYKPDHPWLAAPLVVLARIDLASEQPEAALPLLERARALTPAAKPDPDVSYPLAKALWLLGRDRPRAQRLFAQARAGYDPSLPANAKVIREIDAWGAAHPPIAEARP